MNLKFPQVSEASLRLAFIKANLWLAPVIPAYYVGQAILARLEAPVIVAWLAGVVVELTGLATNHITVVMWEWNRQAKESKAPVWLGALLLIGQLVIGMAIAVLLEVLPQSKPYAPAGFFLLAAIAYATGALQLSQQARELAQAKNVELSKLTKRFWKVVKERGLARELGELALLEAGNDPVAALKLLPQPIARSLPSLESEPSLKSSPFSTSRPGTMRSPARRSEPLSARSPDSSSEPVTTRSPSTPSEPVTMSSPDAPSELSCPKCGALIDRRGRPWISGAAIRGHLAFCTGEPVSENGQEMEKG